MSDYIKETGKSVGSIYITGGGFVNREFKGASPTSAFGWEELGWKKTPSRGTAFALTDIDNIDVGLVPRCEIEISYMRYEDYTDMRQILKQKHYSITFVDFDNKEWTTRDMYCTDNSKKQFLILDRKILGAVSMTLKFVGTNLDLIENGNSFEVKKYTIQYIENDTTSTDKTKEIYWGGQITLETESSEIKTGYHLNGWVTKNSDGEINGYYGLGQSITVWKDLTFYPWFIES